MNQSPYILLPGKNLLILKVCPRGAIQRAAISDKIFTSNTTTIVAKTGGQNIMSSNVFLVLLRRFSESTDAYTLYR
jgi:hypothetical protein